MPSRTRINLKTGKSETVLGNLMDSDANHIAIHGALGGLIKCSVLKHPSKDTTADHIKLEWKASGGTGKRQYAIFRDDEALIVARLLLWAFDRRAGMEYIEIGRRRR